MSFPSSGGGASGAVTITQTSPATNGVYPLETGTNIAVTLSLDTSAYADGDILADTQAITGVSRANDKSVVLSNLNIIDKNDQKQGLILIFLKSNVSLGTENAAPNISDANAENILGMVTVGSSDYIDLGGVSVAQIDFAPITLIPASGTTTVYIAAISKGTGTYSASGIVVNLGIIRA